MKQSIFIIATLLTLTSPLAAQDNLVNKRHYTDKRKFTPALEGTPGYYDLNTRSLFKQGKWKEGKAILDKGMENYGSLSALNELMGQYWLHYSQYDKARYYLIRSLKDDKQNLHSKHMMLKVEELTKNYSSAIVYCNELLESAPYDYALWKKKIQLYRLQGNEIEATRLLKRLSEIYPEREDVKREMIDDLETKYRQQRTKKDIPGQEDMLRKLVELNPKNTEYQMALCNLLLQTGRTEEAVDVAGYAAKLVDIPYPFVEKRVGILEQMGRYNEAQTYIKEVIATIPKMAAYRGLLSRLETNIEREAAHAALQNDPYTAFAKLYAKTHDGEALTYLLNTSMSRGYNDDALMYIREARKQRGDTQNLMLREYTVQRRLNNMHAALGILETIHRRWPNNQEANEELCSLRLDEVRRMMDFAQWDEAIALLETITDYKVDFETKDAINHRLFTCYIKTDQRSKALQLLPLISQDAQTQAELYEDIMMPYVKQLMLQGRLHEAEAEIQKVIEKGHPSADIMSMGITAALLLKKNTEARNLIEKGRERFPDELVFKLKDAQMKAQEGDHEGAMAILKPMTYTYVGDSAVIRAYADCCESLAMQRLKDKDYEGAMQLVDDAMTYYPNSQQLILAKSMVYEKQKEWAKAVEMYRLYKPGWGDMKEYNLHMEMLKRHLMPNQLFFDYQRARPSGEDKITSLATVTYTRSAKNNEYSFGFIYAGRDGSTMPESEYDAAGGSGIELNGEWQHRWTDRLTTTVMGGWASKFMPKIKASISASYDLRDDWTAKGSISYRLIGDDNSTSLIGASIGATKTIEQFNVGVDVHGFAMSGDETLHLGRKIFVNGSLVGKYFPIEGSRTHLMAMGSVGNAPELSLIDNSLPVRFNQLNTMLGFGGLYAFSSVLDFGVSGQWYTMSTESTDGSNLITNKNYLYLNANITIHF